MAIFYLRMMHRPLGRRGFAYGVYLVLVGVFTGALTPLARVASAAGLFRKALGDAALPGGRG